MAVFGTAAQIVPASTPKNAQTVNLFQTVVCQQSHTTVTLYANAPVVPWRSGPVAFAIFSVCRTICRDAGLAGTAEVMR